MEQIKFEEIIPTVNSKVIVCLLLALLTLITYASSLKNEFIDFDDSYYVTENVYVRKGLSLDGLKWAYGDSIDNSYWHPLTWLSHMMDVTLFGMNPGMHRLTNVLFHLVNTLLLFLFWERATGHLWNSAFVAAIFALHPINVESVAWVAERKNVLSTFFFMLVLNSYLYYLRKPNFSRYLLILLLFALGLQTKTMIVTLPCVLLLLDFWPLQRIKVTVSKENLKKFGILCLEKIPLLLLALLATAIFLSIVSENGMTIPFEQHSLNLRISNALISYWRYLGHFFWPENLVAFYPYPTEIALYRSILAFAGLVFVSGLVLCGWSNYPWLTIGWFWFLGTLIPAIGIKQAGLWPAMADRYAYIPHIGISVMIAWGLTGFIKSKYHKGIGLSAVIIVLICSLVAYKQMHYWENDFKLWKRVLTVDNNNYVAHNNLGSLYVEKKDYESAIRHFEETIKLKPRDPRAYNNLGSCFLAIGKIGRAISYFKEAIRIQPNYANAQYNLGRAYVQKPDLKYLGHNKIGMHYVGKGDYQSAINHFEESIRLNPLFAEAQNNLGNCFVEVGKIDQAINHFREAVRIKPDFSSANYNLANAYFKRSDLALAAKYFSKVIELNREDADAYNKLGEISIRKGEVEDALRYFSTALRLRPNDSVFRKNVIKTKAFLKKVQN